MNKVKENKDLIKNIFRNVTREGVDRCLAMLDRTDYFTAPASKYYHSPYKGGLVQHSLYVFFSMLDFLYSHSDLADNDKEVLKVSIQKLKSGEVLAEAEKEFTRLAIVRFFGEGISLDSIIICSLLHDLHKLNFYEECTKNVFKGYDANGKKIFEEETSYKVRDDIFIFGDEGSNSNYLIRGCFKMSYEEQLAVQNHMGYSDGVPQGSASKAWAKSPFSLYLHLADMEATYYYERR